MEGGRWIADVPGVGLGEMSRSGPASGHPLRWLRPGRVAQLP